MARIRSIKPEFFDDPIIGQLTPLARLVFIGLWTQADREGRVDGDLGRLKARILPYDDCSLVEILGELVDHGRIVLYTACHKPYIWIRKFADHQRPHPKESASVIPPPPKRARTAKAVKFHGKPGKETERTVDLDPDLDPDLDQDLDQGRGAGSSDAAGAAPPPPLSDPALQARYVREVTGPLVAAQCDDTRTVVQTSQARIEQTQTFLAGKRAAKPPPWADGRSGIVFYRGRRFTVWGWQMDQLQKLLGPHFETFGCDEWFAALDAQTTQHGSMVPQHDGGVWLLAKTTEEAIRRGLPMDAASTKPNPMTQSQFAPGTSTEELTASLRRSLAEKRR